MGFPLSAYLARIGVDRVKSTLKANLPTLALVMASQSRAIAFENLSVVQRETISIDPADIINKLIDCGRGGYCFEQNMLLQDALREIGFEVVPLLCRVRWNKTADQETPFTHMALKVKLDDGRKYLADVGFGGTNSIAPLQLGKDSEPQQQPEGLFRTITDSAGFNTLQWEIKGEWRALYMFNAEQTCLFSDLEQSNWSVSALVAIQAIVSGRVRVEPVRKSPSVQPVSPSPITGALVCGLFEKRDVGTEKFRCFLVWW